MTAAFETIPTAGNAVPEHGAEIYVPLNRLKKSEKNARKTPHRSEDIETLAATIHAKGILQPPVVEPELDEQGHPTGNFLVTIGEGRRLAQLLRAKRKQIKKTEPIRCLIDTANDAYEISLDENVTRFAMHPADQFEAFRRLVEERGFGVEEVRAEPRCLLSGAMVRCARFKGRLGPGRGPSRGRSDKHRSRRGRGGDDLGLRGIEVDEDLTPIERGRRIEIASKVLTGGHDRVFRSQQLIYALAFDVLAALKALDTDIEVQSREGHGRHALEASDHVAGRHTHSGAGQVLLSGLAVVDHLLVEFVARDAGLFGRGELHPRVETEDDGLRHHATLALRALKLELHIDPHEQP